jgi:hypothetical protein
VQSDTAARAWSTGYFLVRIFQPDFSFWPPPQFLGDSPDGLTAWMVRRDANEDRTLEQLRVDAVKQIIDAHHDRHARTIGPRR